MNKELYDLLREGNLEKLKILLASNPELIQQKDQFEQTLLHIAISQGQLGITSYLLEQKLFNAKERNTALDTALITAVSHNKADIVKYLLEHRYSDIAEKNEDGKTALLMAAMMDRITILKYLLQHYPKTIQDVDREGNNALFVSIIHDNLQILECLLQFNPKLLLEKTPKGETPLLLAAKHGRSKMLSLLFRLPALNLKETNEQTGEHILSLAARFGNLSTVKFLLKKGIYLDLLLPDGRTILEVLTQGRRRRSNKSLILIEAATKLVNYAKNHSKEILESLEEIFSILEKNINARTIEAGNTALHYALLNNHSIDFIVQLLERDANIDLPNDKNVTPFELLISHSSYAIQSLGYFFKAKKLYNTLHNNTKESKESKESKETKSQSEALNKIISSGIECLTKANSTHQNYLLYGWGSFLGGASENPINPKEAYDLLIKIPKNDKFFSSANELIYKLLAGNKLILSPSFDLESTPHAQNREDILNFQFETEEQRILNLEALIKHLLYSGARDQPLSNYVAEYLCAAGQGMQGIKDFYHFEEADSCVVLLKKMRLDNLKLKKELQEEKMALNLQKEDFEKNKRMRTQYEASVNPDLRRSISEPICAAGSKKRKMQS